MFRNLNAEQARADVSNIEMAAMLKISPETYKKKKSGEIEFKFKEMQKIKEYLSAKLNKEFTFEYLFERDGVA